MRSLLVICGLAALLAVVFLSGSLPRRARATPNTQGASSGLELRYADYDSEGPPVAEYHSSHPSGAAEQEPPAEAASGARAQPAAPPEPAPEAPAEPQSVPDVPEDDASGPTADAGQDRIVWLGDDRIQLDGSASAGDGLTYYWRQTGGPVTLYIKNPAAAKTTASGLTVEPGSGADQKYEFELDVTDRQGRSASDTVTYTVKAAPALSTVPPARRELAYRDGYLFMHFQMWKTNRAEEFEVFEVRSKSELTFHHIGGRGRFEITPARSEGRYGYTITVYYLEGETTTWLEFFVDTPERVPAILQIGVNWE